jgi:6-phosphogluconolactonase
MDKDMKEMTSGRKILMEENLDLLSKRGADILRRVAKECTGKGGLFTLALSGGSEPRPMYSLLAQEPYASDVPWHSTHLFWVDERMVPFDHPDSNFGTAKGDFVERVPLPSDQVHPMPTWMKPEEGASVYESEMKSLFRGIGEGEFPVFDLIFLGIGTDGHTASLFPGQDSLSVMDRWVLNVEGGEPKVPRLTLSLPVLNRAKRIVFLVSGKEKAAVLKTILEEPEARLPAQRIQPAGGTLTWLVDRDAASLLSTEATHA